MAFLLGIKRVLAIVCSCAKKGHYFSVFDIAIPHLISSPRAEWQKTSKAPSLPASKSSKRINCVMAQRRVRRNNPPPPPMEFEDGWFIYKNNRLRRNLLETVEKCRIHESVTSIPVDAFFEAKLLKEIIIPNTVTSIGSGAFYNCRKLESIQFPSSLTMIGNHVLDGCTSLTKIEIPNSITSIRYASFANCKALKTIEIPDSVEDIGSHAFRDCHSLENVIIPSHRLTAISDHAFQNCKSLKDIQLPEHSLTFIGDHAFQGCSGLNFIKIPNSVGSIGRGAFQNCEKLVTVLMPKTSRLHMHNNAFADCKALRSFEAQGLPLGAWGRLLWQYSDSGVFQRLGVDSKLCRTLIFHFLQQNIGQDHDYRRSDHRGIVRPRPAE